MSSDALFDITVSPKSSRSRIVIEDDCSIKLYLNSPPVDGKANSECLVLLSKSLKIAKSRIRIIKGEKGRHKRILIQGISYDEIIKKIKDNE